jgi:hypothetical protein
MFFRLPIIVFISAVLLLSGSAFAAASAGESPSLVESLRLNEAINFCGEDVPLSDNEVREAMEKELLLSLWDRDQVILWLKRSTRYFPVIEQMLAEAGLPDDLKYVAIAESALRPHAGSSKGAIGFWQFMPETGRRYGLTVTDDIDERRNLVASTQAAISYYLELYDTFDSWSLSAAAFNMGEEGLRAEILAQGVDNFYRLYLSLETQRYLFRILSAKLILTDPERYGFYLEDEDYYQPLKTSTVELTLFEEASIRIVAQAAETDFKRIKNLNPELRGHYLQAGTYRLVLPENMASGFLKRFEIADEAWRAQRQERIYLVKSGDNLSTIADQFDVPLAALLIWNHINLNDTLHPGDRLIINPAEIETDSP